ncbi:hypothetical protein QAD02_008586 [Eretmocerus hayati]|uniref:Uncharacterized protein n=1 Tax=Eretmocerus hayati TaxID=131215 RepID=A0ACC2N6T8_9HYME|nr:hypothetical protein QAD02_008586 [Eretmocerus hayati]
MPIGKATGSLVVLMLLSTAGVIAGAIKCCGYGLVLEDDFHECVSPSEPEQEMLLLIGEEEEDEEGEGEMGRRIFDRDDVVGNNKSLFTELSCFQVSAMNSSRLLSNEGLMNCSDYHKNGSLIHLECFNMSRKLIEGDDKCRSIFESVHIYGATMLIFANIVYALTYGMVIIIYALVPKLCRRAYDKAVLSFVITQFFLSLDIIGVGHYLLCHKAISDLSYALFGLGMMTFTISGCLWLLVISIELASTITSLRWAPSSGAKGRDENHKFLIYLIWVTFGTLIPATVATILQFSPLREDHIAHPTFHKMMGVNYRVIVHVTTVPLLVAISSQVLFIYTTLKMMSIKKSSNMAHENRKNGVKDKYILYLKLYLLMDAPYVTGALAAIFENLWILKFVRVSQPVLMLYAVLPRDMMIKLIPWKKKLNNNNNRMQSQPNNKTIRTVAGSC